MSHLRAAAVALPRWSRGTVRVEGPDEDAFTLLVRAGELLRRASPTVEDARAEVRSVRLVASMAGEDRDALFEAWGMPPVELITYPDTSDGVVQALSDALDASLPERQGRAWVLGVQTSRTTGRGVEDPPKESAGAVALAFDGESGPSFHASDAEPPRTWVTGSLGPGAPARPLPVPGLRSHHDAPHRLLLTLVEAASQAAHGERVVWVHATGERTARRELLDGRPVVLAGYPLEEEELLEMSEEGWRALAGAPLGAVSQGAYLSLESYKASLPARWRLEGESCSGCGGWTFPPTGRCHRCGMREGLRRGRLAREGARLESATVIRKGAQPTEFDFHQETYGPYGVGLVRFPEGPRLTFQITDERPASSEVGGPVELVLRRLYPQEGAWRYGLKARRSPAVGPTARPTTSDQ